MEAPAPTLSLEVQGFCTVQQHMERVCATTIPTAMGTPTLAIFRNPISRRTHAHDIWHSAGDEPVHSPTLPTHTAQPCALQRRRPRTHPHPNSHTCRVCAGSARMGNSFSRYRRSCRPIQRVHAQHVREACAVWALERRRAGHVRDPLAGSHSYPPCAWWFQCSVLLPPWHAQHAVLVGGGL